MTKSGKNLTPAEKDRSTSVHHTPRSIEQEGTKKRGKAQKKDSTYDKLSAPLPIEGIQRTTAGQTKKGYDTTGYGYQYVVNRFNEVFGVGGWDWTSKVIHEEQGKFQSGSPYIELAVAVTIVISRNAQIDPSGDLHFDLGAISHTEYGGHRAGNYADAIKGASTNGLKKCAAFFGVGKTAYEGSIDDDNRSVIALDKEKVIEIQETEIREKPKTVKEIMEKMDKELTPDNAEAWAKAIAEKPGYTKAQRRVMQLRLEELIKEFDKDMKDLFGEHENKELPQL